MLSGSCISIRKRMLLLMHTHHKTLLQIRSLVLPGRTLVPETTRYGGKKEASSKEKIEEKRQNGVGIDKGKAGKVIACVNSFCFVLIGSFVMSILTKFRITKKEEVKN